MREILFKGKTRTGKWVEGDYQSFTYSDGNKCNIISVWAEFSEYDIIPETVGQYTGLTDKNGTKIFEGDIVKIIEKGMTAIGVVKFRNIYAGGWIIGDNNTDDNGCSLCMRNDVEVIGNIHDTPELIKGGGNE